MSWEAANVPKPHGDGTATPVHHRQASIKRDNGRGASSETVEAALSRLSKAYNTSMECIGAMQKTDQMITRQVEEEKQQVDGDSDQALTLLTRVGNAARKTLEVSILLDPLILPYAPSLHQYMVELSEKYRQASPNSRWTSVEAPRPIPPVISSAAHNATLIQLAYLSLINYSDLLQSSCQCYTASKYNNKTTILDRGITTKYKALLHPREQEVSRLPSEIQMNVDCIPPCLSCCWQPEIPEETQRLAVAALCDASNLKYASDPTLWLKLACASRALERIHAQRDNTTIVHAHHRRLQRHALECGSVALPSHVPPNRTLLRALTELLQEEAPQEYISCRHDSEGTKTVELPRYSWVVLGRILLRACSGEEAAAITGAYRTHSNKHNHPQRQIHGRLQFGSQNVALRLSPILVLPHKVLGSICRYLDNSSTWRFEATCRALSVTLVSARASVRELEGAAAKIQRLQQVGRDDNESESKNGGEGRRSGTSGSSAGVDEQTHNSKPNASVNAAVDAPPPPVPARQSSRSSKRLISQQISSEKMHDREGNRKSFNYCFLAATLFCTKIEHDEMTRKLQGKEQFAHLYEGTKNGSSMVSRKSQLRRLESSSEVIRTNRIEAKERLSDSSLAAFVTKWDLKNSGSFDLLEKFLIHVSMNVGEIFSSDPGTAGTNGLISCIMACFETMFRRSGSYERIAPSFYNAASRSGSFERSLDLFSLDLLYAELMLRECDRNTPNLVGFDDEENLVSVMVPMLVNACAELAGDINAKQSNENEMNVTFLHLQARCYWLSACFYLWRSRVAPEVYVSREAEEEGTLFIGEAIKCFESCELELTKPITTPHLVSSGRQEAYWGEISPLTLAKFRDEIQASSVVSAAKEQFQELLSRLDTPELPEDNHVALGQADIKAFTGIGKRLLARYRAPYGHTDSKLTELVENFLSLHGNYIMPLGSTDETEHTNKWVDALLPFGPLSLDALQSVANPSILTMMFICLNLDPSNLMSAVQILLSLVLTTADVHGSLLRSRALRRQASDYSTDEAFSDTDDDSVMSNDQQANTLQKNDDEKKTVQCGSLFKIFLDRLTSSLHLVLSEKDRLELVKSDEFHNVVNASLEFSNKWFGSTARTLSHPSGSLDLDIFQSVSRLVRATGDSGARSTVLQSIMFKGMARIITSQSDLLRFMTSQLANKTVRAHRSAKQRLCILRSEYIAQVASGLGLMLSENLGSIENHSLAKNGLLFGEGDTRKLSRDEEVLFVSSVMWLRKFSCRSYEEGQQSKPEDFCASYERPIVKKLRIPIATLVVGLCGSASTSRKSVVPSGDLLGLTEFFDSDTSVNDWGSDNECDDDENPDFRKRELLRAICHAVHCIAVTLDGIDDKDSVKQLIEGGFDSKLGPTLPLVCTRVLNFFADTLLRTFGIVSPGGSESRLLWAEEYPYHTQDTGEFLDSVLHKVYRWLYGFVLIGEWDHLQSSGKDLAHSLSSIYEISKRAFRPENTSAAAQLYRCIVRAYAKGRRTPPKAALELVSSALPPQRESQRSALIRGFIFSGESDHLSLSTVSALVKKGDQWELPFVDISSCLEGSPSDDIAVSCEESEATYVRRDLSSRLASGPLPAVSIDMASEDDRTRTAAMEEEIAKKFNAILDDICLSGAGNCENWYRAAQCVSMKADVIADRLGLSLGFGRIKHFVALSRRAKTRSCSLEKLIEEQKWEDLDIAKSHISSLGGILSEFVDHPWSSFSSLQECARRVQQSVSDSESTSEQRKAMSLAVLHQVGTYLKNGDHLKWQEAWGGIFVQALRQLSLRFMSVALYVARSMSRGDSADQTLMSEICEAIGVSMYSELMASQRYGWPMDKMSTLRKRLFAESARECFKAAISFVETASDKDDSSEARATWDLLFMIGKCEEKIAFSYQKEAYDSSAEIRFFERHMEAALKAYSNALEQAKSIEEEGRQLAEQAGGSAHGSTEVLYRLHASRLKILLQAVSRRFDELDRAELEALRLTEMHWFSQPKGDAASRKEKHLRDRVWDVFADVVGGLAECRQVQPFFHRSVYRHAQALMWAPVLNDPRSSAGSMNTVPATRSFAIRGLNNSTPAAVSAGVVMSKLFDKKRSQLCAVWVTTNSESSPFQVLNAAIRKYDSLRGKYITAYLESMNLCNRRGEIETLLKWIYASKRDLPSYFQASAISGGGRPAEPHARDPLLLADALSRFSYHFSNGLLISSKRLANGFLSKVLLQEMSEKLGTGGKSSPVDSKKSAESYLKHAYACYLRLNCGVDELKKTRAFKFGGEPVYEVEAMCQAYLYFASPDELSSTPDFGDWSGGNNRKSHVFFAALGKCKQLFPSLSGTFFSKKGAVKAKGSGDKKRKESSVDLSSPTSPSAQGTKKISFEVTVPKGLTTGDTFLTSVNVGSADPIKVKLTVPSGNPSTLRFNLDVPKSSTRKITKKAKLSL